jgi:Txe/YoeB family toxin of Txe-Axe toxin-antitoxin module
MRSYKGKIKKKISIKLVGDAETAFKELNKLVGEQRKQGIASSKNITLLNAINRLFDVIVNNPFYGENAKKGLIPKEYKQKYDVSNLFIADLPDYWRMIYTLESDEIEIVAFVLDIIDHDKYNKKFKFRKR